MLQNRGDLMVDLTGGEAWSYLSWIGVGMLPALMFHVVNMLVRPERMMAIWIALGYTFSGLPALSSPWALFHPKVRQFVDGVSWNV